MRKKILGVTFIVVLAVLAAFNINLNKSNNKGDLMLANVEALAQTEYLGLKYTVTGTLVDSHNTSNTSGTSCPAGFLKGEINVYSSPVTTVVNNPGITGANANATSSGTGGGVGASVSTGQTLYVSYSVNCGPSSPEACCDPSKNGVHTDRIN